MIRELDVKVITKAVEDMCISANKILPGDVKNAVLSARDTEQNPLALSVLKDLEEKDPLEILAYQYDLVANGYEVASGAVRNTDKDIMLKLFDIVGYGEEEIQKRFGALYTAFQFGGKSSDLHW